MALLAVGLLCAGFVGCEVQQREGGDELLPEVELRDVGVPEQEGRGPEVNE